MRAQFERVEARVQRRECRGESTESRVQRMLRMQSREEEARGTIRAQCMMRAQRREYRVRVQRRENRVESAESRVQSRECTVESTQSRDEGAKCTVRAQFERADAECSGESTQSRVQSVRECKDESTEIARMHSLSADSRVQRVRVQRVRECRDETAIQEYRDENAI